MLEELGLGEASTQDEADVIVLNTCTIREKPDTKFAAYMGNAAALKRQHPDMVIAVGGCYAEAQRERLFSLYPDVDVAFGPGTISHLGEWLGAGGVGVDRGDVGYRATSGASRPSCRCIASAASRRGCRSRWAATRRARTASSPRCAAARSSRRPGEVLAEVTQLAQEGVRELTLLGSERQLVGARPTARHPHGVRRAPAGVRCGRRDRAHPLHEPAPEGLPPPRDRGDGRVRRCLRARAPPAAVRVDTHPEGDAPHVFAGALSASSSTRCVPAFPISRSRPTSSSASRARPRPTSSRRSRSSRRCGSTAHSHSSTRRARERMRQR